MVPKASMNRSAFSGDAEIRWSSLKDVSTSWSASGMKSPVKSWRKAGFGLPHAEPIIPIRCSPSRALSALRSFQPRAKEP